MMEQEQKGPKTVNVSIPSGSSVPGCEESNECYIPYEVMISVGDTVSWSNDDTAAHTVTSGNPSEGPDGNFDSSLIIGGAVYEFTFEQEGNYNYFCMVHPWMTGIVQVN
jgi:plastocyanin